MDIARILINMGFEGSFNLKGDEYEGLEWTDKNTRAPTLETIQANELALFKADGKEQVQGIHAAALFKATGNARTEERDTWDAKREAAKQYVAGSADAGQIDLLEQEALATGEATADLAGTIMAKADAFYKVAGEITGGRRVAQKEIEAAQDKDGIVAAVGKYASKVATLIQPG